jgi:hypothetical protein
MGFLNGGELDFRMKLAKNPLPGRFFAALQHLTE